MHQNLDHCLAYRRHCFHDCSRSSPCRLTCLCPFFMGLCLCHPIPRSAISSLRPWKSDNWLCAPDADRSTELPVHGSSLLKSGWNRSLQEARVWFGLLQPSPIVAAPGLAVEVAASSRGFEFFDLLVAAVDPLGTCPRMRLVSAVSRSHLCMMLATISHSLPRVGFE